MRFIKIESRVAFMNINLKAYVPYILMKPHLNLYLMHHRIVVNNIHV